MFLSFSELLSVCENAAGTCAAMSVHNAESVNPQRSKKQALPAPVSLYEHSLDLLPQPHPDWRGLEHVESRGASCHLDALRNLISHKTP